MWSCTQLSSEALSRATSERTKGTDLQPETWLRLKQSHKHLWAHVDCRVKRFLGGCQQNRHLRHRERERERETGEKERAGPSSGPLTWSWEALTGSSMDAVTIALLCCLEMAASCTGNAWRRATEASNVRAGSQHATGQARLLWRLSSCLLTCHSLYKAHRHPSMPPSGINT